MKINNDKHLNIFWPYNGINDSKENIQRAIINFLQYSEMNSALDLLDKLMNNGDIFKEINLQSSKITKIEYSLKGGLNHNKVEEFPYRFLLALNPSGKAWNNEVYEEFDMQYDNYLNDLVLLKDDRLKVRVVEQFETSINKEYVAKNINLIREMIERCIRERDCKTEPSPTGWVAIYQDKRPFCLIAIENKIHDFDPFQLNNYLRDTLKIDKIDYDSHKVVSSYENLYSTLLQIKESFIRDNLLEYLYLLGYEPVSSFSEDEFSLAIAEEDSRLINKKWDKILQIYFSTMPEQCDEFDYIISSNRIHFNDIISGEISFCVKDINKEPVLCISSEIGVDEMWKNTKLATVLNKNVMDRFRSIYFIDESYKNDYELWWRINTEDISYFEHIEKYNQITELLNNFKTDVYDSIILRNDLLVKLCDKKNLDLNSDEVKTWQFNTWKYTSFNRLNYMKINTYISKENLFINNKEKSLEKIYSMLDIIFDMHREGLCYINSLLCE